MHRPTFNTPIPNSPSPNTPIPNTPIPNTSIPNLGDLAAAALASATLHLFPGVVLLGGGSHSLGFYYDFILEQPLTEHMLELIEVHLHRFLKEDHPIRFISMMRENAQTLLEHKGHFLLSERAGRQNVNILDLVQIGDFYDLCQPHALASTRSIGHIKLLEAQDILRDIQGEDIAVTRIIGNVQKTSRDLKVFCKTYDSYLKKKDHRILGPRLNLFHFSETTGELGVAWHPKGLTLQKILLDFAKSQLADEEEQISTISTALVVPVEYLSEDPCSLEPFDFEGKSYRLRTSPLLQHLEFLEGFPLSPENPTAKVSECGLVYRQYPESRWWGLFCRSVYLSEQTTICCVREQVASELISSLHFIEQIITIFGFEAQWVLVGSRPKSSKNRKGHGALKWLEDAIKGQSTVYPVSATVEEQEGQEGQGGQEGPRLELRVKDELGRDWPVSSVGVAIHPSERILPSEGEKKRVILIRRLWESLDRFIALLIEKHEGKLPVWIAPEQVRVLAIGEANIPYAKQVATLMKKRGLRVRLDLRRDKLSLRIHEAEKECIPHLVLAGEQERKSQTVSVRSGERSNQSRAIDVETFIDKVCQESICPDPKREIQDRIRGENKKLES